MSRSNTTVAVAREPRGIDGALGKMTFSMFGRRVTYYGGPYRNRPRGMIGVKMAKEIKASCHYDVPTVDFQTPPRAPMYKALVQTFARGLVNNAPLYVGCMAGRGRTGLFLATLAYLTGHNEPVKLVRAVYYPHAVETEEQARYVMCTFDRGEFRRDVMREVFRDVTARWFWSMPWRDKLLLARVAFTLV